MFHPHFCACITRALLCMPSTVKRLNRGYSFERCCLTHIVPRLACSYTHQPIRTLKQKRVIHGKWRSSKPTLISLATLERKRGKRGSRARSTFWLRQCLDYNCGWFSPQHEDVFQRFMMLLITKVGRVCLVAVQSHYSTRSLWSFSQ